VLGQLGLELVDHGLGGRGVCGQCGWFGKAIQRRRVVFVPPYGNERCDPLRFAGRIFPALYSSLRKII
jgi:hypothetical protein